jgi:hypothetical protein
MAVEFRNSSGCVALVIGSFGVVRNGHAIFSVYGTRVRDQWQQRALGELLVRRLEVATLEECVNLKARSMEMTLPGGECHFKVASLLMYCKCGWQIIHRSKRMTSEQLRGLLNLNIEMLNEAHAEYSRCDVEKALAQAKVAADKALRKAIARAEVTQAATKAVRLADAEVEFAVSMLSLAQAQSAKEQKDKHRPPDARVAQQQRWVETVEQLAPRVDVERQLQTEARRKLRWADIALRGDQTKFVESNTKGYTIFKRGEHSVRIPSPKTVANDVMIWTSVFNRGVGKKSPKPSQGMGGRWQGRKTANPSVDAPSIVDMESDVLEWLGQDGLNWLMTASGEVGTAQKTVEAHALLRGVAADIGAKEQYSGKPARDAGGWFVNATTPQQKPIHADSCWPNSHAKEDAPWGDAHLSMIISLQDGTQLIVCPFDKGGEEVTLTLNAGDIVIFRGDLIHTGAAYDVCNLSVHAHIDSPRAPHQRDAMTTYAVDGSGGAQSHWPIS